MAKQLGRVLLGHEPMTALAANRRIVQASESDNGVCVWQIKAPMMEQ